MVPVSSEVYISQISKTRDSLIVRDESKDNYDKFVDLRDSMSRNGLIEPIVIRPVNNRGSYEVVAGNRRLEAAKQLEWKKINSVIEDISDAKLRRLAFIENVYRQDLNDSEKAKSIAAIYQDIGFEPDKAIQIVKNVHNHGFPSPSQSRKDPRGGKQNPNNIPTVSFIEAFKDIGIPANSQYKLLQLIVQLDEDILDEAERGGMSLESKVMLANPRIRKKKSTQKKIIKDIKGLKGNKARQRIKQHIDAADENKEVEDRPTDKTKEDLLNRYLDFSDLCEKLIAKTINRPLTKSELHFKETMIDSRKDQIFALVKSLGDTKQLDELEEQVSLLDHLIRLILQTIDQVRMSNEKQREILKP
jgi:ParB/RepB/Spo0J family partition protein